MDSVSLSGPVCSTCGASLTRGVCAACALGDLLPKGETRTPSSSLNADFGRYLLKKKIAAGGMGIVYRAEDQQLKRTVALKMVKGSTFASEGDMARFTIETEAAAALDHPNITPVYEVGVIDDQPFFTMKLISGESLASRLRADTRPDLRRCVQWLASIAKAVQHAHQRGVLHRDLKPGNILIDTSDKPWLTDFGLAKMVEQESGLTLSSDRLGTPSYMAPEVIRGNAHAVSTASDVWALGVMLWECLCGELPFEAKDPLEVMRLIGQQDPRTEKTVDRDLLTLAQRCLEKDPRRRVASAGVVAEELGRWLVGAPLTVRPVTGGERLWKWGKRNPALAAFLIVFVLGSLNSVRLWHRAERAVDSLTFGNEKLTQSLATASATHLAAQARLQIEENASRALLLAAESVDMSKRANGEVLPATAEALYQAMQEFGGTDLSVSTSQAASFESGFISRSPSREYPLCFSEDQRKVVLLDHFARPGIMAAGYDLHVTPPRCLFRFPIWPRDDAHAFQAIDWLTNSRQLLAVEPSGTVRLWAVLGVDDPESQVLGSLVRPGEALFKVWLFPIVNDDHMKGVAFYSNQEDRATNSAVFFTVSPSASEPVGVGRPQALIGWEGLRGALWMAAPSKRWLYVQAGDQVSLVRVDPDKETITWETLPKEQSVDEAVAFSHDERTLIHQASYREIRRLDLSSGSLSEAIASSTPLYEHPFSIDAFAISANGSQLAFADNRGDIFVSPSAGPISPHWVTTGEESWHRLRFSLDGRWLGAGGVSPTAFVWPLSENSAMPSGAPMRYRGLKTTVLDLVFTPDAQGVIAYGSPARARHWSFEHGTQGSLPAYAHIANDPILEIALSPDNEWCAVACKAALDDQAAPVKLVRQRDGMAQTIGYHAGRVTGCAFSADGRWLGSTGRDGMAQLWDVASLTAAVEEGRSVPEPCYRFDTNAARPHYHRRLAFHPANRLYITCGDGVLFEWDLTAPDPLITEKHHRMHSINFLLPDVTVSHDGQWLAVARHGWDSPAEGVTQYGNMVLLYDASDPGELVFKAALPAHFLDAADLAFSTEGRWLAANGAGQGATIWDLASTDIVASRVVSPIADHLIKSIAFSQDGRWLGLGASDGRLHLWDWQNGDLRTINTGKSVNALEWFSDTRLLAGDSAGRLANWETDVALLSRQARDSVGRELTSAERSRFGLD